MGSSYFGIPKMGEKSSSSSSSSRKGKKSGAEKPKQPQRGLGVAQLEQIRLRSQLGCSGFSSSTPTTFIQDDVRLQGVPNYNPYYSQSSPSTSYADHPNFMMVFGDHERSNLRYQDSQPSTAPRWNPNGDPRHQRIDFLNTHNSESSEHDEVDLELRLSI
ncbi:Protein SPEAR3 [Bienertia sinuspersici]